MYYYQDAPLTVCLEHSGKKGMHWGERNYQNPDGTWTELGKELRRKGTGIRDKAKDVASAASKKAKDAANIASAKLNQAKETIEEKAKKNNITKDKVVKAALIGAGVVGAVVIGSKIASDIKQRKEEERMNRYAEECADKIKTAMRMYGIAQEDYAAGRENLPKFDTANNMRDYYERRTKRYLDAYNDVVVPAGSEIGTVNKYQRFNQELGENRVFWASDDEEDKRFYTGTHALFAKLSDKSDKGRYMYQHILTSDQDIKLAGKEAGGNQLAELYFNSGNDIAGEMFREDFWDRMDSRSGPNANKKYAARGAEKKAAAQLRKAYMNRDEDPDKFADMIKDKGYDIYNISMQMNGDYKNRNATKETEDIYKQLNYSNDLIEGLKSKGYGGIRDINDIYYSSYDRNNPAMYFKDGIKYTEKEVNTITMGDAAKTALGSEWLTKNFIYRTLNGDM